MANKITVNVDIRAQAQELEKIVSQSRQSLQNLSPKIDTQQMKLLEKSLTDIQTKSQNLSNNLATGLSSPAAFQKANKDIQGLYQQYSNFVNKVGKMGIKSTDFFPSTPEFQKVMDQYKNVAKQKGDVIGKEFGQGISKNVHQAMREAMASGDAKKVAAIGKAEQSRLSTENRSVAMQAGKIGKAYGTDAAGATKAIEAEMAKVRAMTKSQQAAYRNAGGRAIGAMEQDLAVTKRYDTYKQQHGAVGKASVNYQQQAAQVEKLTQSLRTLETELNKLAGPARANAQNGLNQIANSEAQVKTQTDTMRNSVDTANRSFDTLSAKAGQMSQLKSYFTYMFSATSIVMRLGQAVRNAIKDFKDLDKQLNEISIVTGKSMDELWGKFSRLNSTAQKYGVVTSDVVSVQKLYYQQGRSTAEVNELTGKTLTFAKISGLEFAEATEYMTAALNAYKISARDANVVTDTYAALSMSAAVDAEELAVAMSKVASLAALSGSDLQDTSAYLTKIIETTREAPETAGTALKTVIARFTAVNKLTADQKELLDEDYNFNNIEKALKTVGVAVKNNVGQMRGFTEILADLGPKWDSLDANTKHYIATQAAGARQQSRFIALMDDWGRTEELMGVAADSAGTGAEQLELAMDSIETKTNQLKASWQSFYSNIITSDFIKGAVDFIRIIIDGLNSIMGLINSISGGIGAISFVLTALIGSLMAAIISKAIGLGKAFGQSFMAGYRAARDKSKAGQYVKEVNDAYTQGIRIGRARAMGEQVGEASVYGKKGAVKAGRAGFMAMSANAAGKGGAAVGGVAAKAGGIIGTIGAAVSAAIPYILVALGAAAVVAAIIAIAKKIDDNKEKEAGNTVKGANKDVEKELDKTKTLTENYTKALKLHRKGLARTEEETEEYQTILGQLNETYPQMVDRTAEGLYTLTEASEKFYEASIRASEAAINAAHKRIAQNAQTAGGAGVYVGERATELNDEIKSMAAILSEQSTDYVAELGESDFTIKVEDITKMSEQGLTREAINEFVAVDYSTDEFKRLMNDYVDIVDEQGMADVNALGWRNKEVLTWFNAINAQYGGSLVAELWEETFGDSVLKTEITNWEDFYETETEVEIPDEFVLSWTAQAQTLRNQILYGNEKGTPNIKQGLYGEEYENTGIELIKKPIITPTTQVDPVSGAITYTTTTLYNGPMQSWYDKMATDDMKKDGIDEEEERRILKSILYQDDLYDESIFNSEELAYFSDFRQQASDAANDFSKTFSAEAAVQQFKTYEEWYTKLPEQSRTQIENYAKQIQTSKAFSDDDIESFIESMGIRDKGFADSLIQILQDEQIKRDNTATELKDRIDALGGQFSDSDIKNYTVAELEFFGNTLDKTFSLYGKEVSGALSGKLKDYYDNFLVNNDVLKSAFAEVDFFDSESIAQYGAQVLKYTNTQSAAWQDFLGIIDEASNAADRATKTMSQVFSSAAEEVEKLSKSFDMIEDGISGELSMEDTFSLLSDYGDILDMSDLEATGEGFKLNIEDSTELARQMLQLKINEYRIEEALLALKKEALMDEIRNTDGWEGQEEVFNKYINLYSKKNKSETDLNNLGKYASELSPEFLTFASQIVGMNEASDAYRKTIELLGQQTIKVDNGMKELADKLTTLTDMLSKLGEYSDIDSYINYLETDNAQQEFIREFSSDKDVVSGAIKQQFTNYGNLVNANLTKAKRATENTAARRQSLEEQYGNFEDYGRLVSFDENGNVQLEDANIKKWAEDIAEKGRTAKTDAEKEAYENDKKRYDLFFERIEGYKEEHSLVAKSTQEAQKYAKAMEELNKTLKQDVKNMEDKFLDLFIKRDEEALESLKERYDAMKQMDQDYLDSVKEAIEEERRLRDRSNEEDDLVKMQKKLELMRMSGGSATEIQALEKEIREKTQSMADTRVDDIIEEQSKYADSRAAKMDKEVTYQEEVLNAKKENMIAYNQEVAELMKQDKETIMNTWRALDTEFQKSTKTNKQLLEADMDAMVTKGLSAKESLASDYIPAIEDAYSNLKEEIGNSNTALTDFADDMKEIGDKNGEVVKSIGNIEDGYLNVKDVLQKIIDMQPELDAALNTASEYINLGVDTGKINIEEDDEKQQKTGTTGALDRGWTYTEKRTIGNSEYYLTPTGRYFDASTTERDANNHVFSKSEGMKLDEVNWHEWTNDAKLFNNGNTEFSNLVYKGGEKKKNVNLAVYEGNDAGLENLWLDYTNNTHERAIQSIPDTVSNMPSKGWYVEDTTTYKGIKIVNLKKGKTGWDAYLPYDDFKKYFNPATKYATGGIVDFTGPAWVDGTKTRPEAFLSANDTQLIGSLRDVLRVNTSFNSLGSTTIQKSGDTYYEIHINVDELGDGYSVDDLMNELEDRIVQVSDNKNVIKVY